MSNEEIIITVKETVIKLRNSKKRYLLIPENLFAEISHDDIGEVRKKEDDNEIQLIYVFNKKELKKGK